MLPVTNPLPVLQSVSQQERRLLLTWSDGSQSHFHFLWLRDNCPTTLHCDTQERVFDQLSVSAGIHPKKLLIEGDRLIIDWSEHGHHSEFLGSWLRNQAYSGDLKRNAQPTSKSWCSAFLNQINRFNYSDLMQDNGTLYEWMMKLDQDGLSLVEGMPSTQTALNDFTNRIDYQRQTNFGVTFEVKTEANPINLAYTSLALPLHTDLSNQETPPGYQFLHCLANESSGGESIFADGFRILEDLREENNDYFELLASYAIPFRFHDDDHDIYHHHPVINLDHRGNIIEIKYNAHLASIFDLPDNIMHDYYLAYRELMARVRSIKYRISLKLTEGTMAVFDNRRVLHGREAFEPTGKRHLRGCYIDRTEFQSRLRVLKKRHG